MKASLRTKFIIFITIAIVAFDLIFLFVSVNLYNKDKESYVYENVYNSNWAVTQLLSKQLDQIRLLSNLDFQESSNIKLPSSLLIENILLFDQNKKKYIYELNPSPSPRPSPSKELLSFLSNVDDEVQLTLGQEGVYLYFWRMVGPGKFLQIVSNVSKFVQNFQQQGFYSVFIFDRKNDLVFEIGSKSKNLKLKVSNIDHIVPGNFQEGTRDLKIQQNEVIVALSQTSDKLLKVVTLIPKAEAFSASKNLIYQNMAIAIIFVGISIIIILFLAKMITNPLVELTRVAESAGLGQYDQHINAKSNDEIGVLVRAFNKMFADIKKYTEELKDKYRIENEIKLAKGVQEQYIPKVDYQNNNIELAGFYLPASECSGDWWNYRVHENITYLFISDVTGHGLPSALLTAAVNSCCSAIDNQIKHTGVFAKPSEMLKVINDVIHQSSADLMLTMCVARIDHENKKIVFSNASHEFPFLMKSNGGVKTLVSRPGLRLGESENAEYEDTEVDFDPSDVLFMYTDGLVENPNSEGNSLGDRFLMRFLKKFEEQPNLLRDNLKQAYFNFIKNGESNDDVTFFFAQLK